MYKTKEEILIKSKAAIGKTFGEIDKYGRLTNTSNKGNLGQVIEESFFEYKINNKSEPDFLEAEVELKVTPFKLNKNGSYSSKERLVLNVIDYEKEVQLTFEDSSFWKKNKRLLLMFYLHDFEKMKKDMKIIETILFEYPKDDLKVIRNDYRIINQKIADGKAHEISESDTLYLGACTKGANSKSVRTQPFSNIKAPARAFSLKSSYMTSILRDYVLGNKENEKILKNIDLEDFGTFENYIVHQVSKYYNVETNVLLQNLGIARKAKSFRAQVISKILNVSSISSSDEFKKSGMKFKTVFINKNGKLKESMSFPHFDFIRLSQETWEESDIKLLFEETKFVFAIFKEDINGIERFHKIRFWSMPQEIIDSYIKEVWTNTKHIIRTGKIVREIISYSNGKTRSISNFPNSTENPVAHVRPHARDSRDTLPLPTPDIKTGRLDYPKHCFWLNSKFILSIINE